MALYNRQTGRLGAAKAVQRASFVLRPWYDNTLSGTGRFDVSNIPQGYSNMTLQLFARSDVSDTGDSVAVFFNGDTTAANYRRGGRISGSADFNVVSDDPYAFAVPAATATANYFGSMAVNIQNYSNSSYYKSVTVTASERRDGSVIYNYITSLHWESANAITQVTVQPDGYATDEFIAGSRLQIWLYP